MGYDSCFREVHFLFLLEEEAFPWNFEGLETLVGENSQLAPLPLTVTQEPDLCQGYCSSERNGLGPSVTQFPHWGLSHPALGHQRPGALASHSDELVVSLEHALLFI